MANFKKAKFCEISPNTTFREISRFRENVTLHIRFNSSLKGGYLLHVKKNSTVLYI